MNEPRSRPALSRWVGLALLVLIAWVLVYSAVSGLSAEYGSGVVGWNGLVPVALVVGLMAAGLARQMFRGANMAPSTPAALAVGAVAAVGVLGVAGMGASVGGAAHDQRQDAIADSCRGGADTRTIEFARKAGRLIPTDGGFAVNGAEGCSVTIAIDKAKGDDPLGLVEQAVAGGEWQQQGDGIWVADDGFQIEAQLEPPFPDEAEHGVRLVGTRP